MRLIALDGVHVLQLAQGVAVLREEAHNGEHLNMAQSDMKPIPFRRLRR